ncbi:MAG: hypothetical protein FH748_04405 [Balneolaceae bacterium]|nr:hypothetical protein [Balneolaceae bacterium]
MSDANNNSYGSLSSAPDGKIIDKIFSYVISVLQDFEGEADNNENYLTNELCKSLSHKKPPGFPFFFHHQNLEDSVDNTSTDFAVYGTFEYAELTNQSGDNFPLVKFEAKRLCSTLPKKREKEYVIGEYKNGSQINNSGGIERFKNLRHGENAPHAGLIGYIQSDTSKSWLKKINKWIQDEINNPHDLSLTWNDNDLLISVPNWSNPKIAYYKSTPQRKNKTQLSMRHIWIKFN